jgi:O-antigen biosynthesis protein
LPSTLRVFIVGDRPNEYSSRVQAEARGLPANGAVRVDIVPETGEPLIYLQASDIGVCSSRSEGYPRVILEKMYFGLALIATLASPIPWTASITCSSKRASADWRACPQTPVILR